MRSSSSDTVDDVTPRPFMKRLLLPKLKTSVCRLRSVGGIHNDAYPWESMLLRYAVCCAGCQKYHRFEAIAVCFGSGTQLQTASQS